MPVSARSTRVLLRTVTAAAALSFAICRGQSGESCKAPYKTGFRIVSVPGGPRTAVWYPTSDNEAPYQYSTDFGSSLAWEGRVSACSRFPLVLFSHGTGGCGTQSIFFTEQLARLGYVVAAPDHKDSLCTVDGSGTLNPLTLEQSFFKPETWTNLTYADRRTDLVKVMDWFAGSALFRSSVDISKVAATGHSLGGYIALGMAGAWPEWRDNRIKVAVGLSPYALPFMRDNRLAGLSAPLMYQGAQLDIGITPFIRGDSGAYSQTNDPKYYVELKGGTHFEWTNLICLGQKTVSGCLSSNKNAQAIVSYAAAFLERYLKADTAFLRVLNGSDVATYQREVPLASVPAGSLEASAGVAPDSIVTSFGDLFAADASYSAGLQPTTLSGVSLSIKDSLSKVFPAPMFFVGGGQVNFLVPAGVSAGRATVVATAGGQTLATGSLMIQSVAPSLFSADATGRGIAAAQVVRAGVDGKQSFDLLFDPASRSPIAVNLGSTSDTVYLTMYGTGMRGGSGIEATVGGEKVPVVGPFAHSVYAGLDQVNLGPLPRTLAGRGLVEIRLSVNGQRANTLTALIR